MYKLVECSMISRSPIFKGYFKSVLETPPSLDILDGSFPLIQLALTSVAFVNLKSDAKASLKRVRLMKTFAQKLP